MTDEQYLHLVKLEWIDEAYGEPRLSGSLFEKVYNAIELSGEQKKKILEGRKVGVLIGLENRDGCEEQS